MNGRVGAAGVDQMQDAFYSRAKADEPRRCTGCRNAAGPAAGSADRTRRGWKGASMSENQATMAPQAEGQAPEFDAIVVGAGFSGLYMLHSLRRQGLSVRVYEQGGGVGGTWYWNGYPGARCDSESVYYMFTDHMSEEILGEWDWSERYAAQPEILRYLEFVTDKMDLRRDIQFNARVVSAVYDAERNRWDVRLADGGAASARFLVTAVGCLSSTNTPKFPGIDTFAGQSYHTGAWPHEGVDFTGKRVAVIGTGATAVQAVPEIAKQAAHVWVFQRTPNYDIPGRNRPLEPGYAAEVKADYKDLWQKARESGFGLPYQIVERSAVDYSQEERQPIFEAAWAKGGFYMGLETFSDYLVNRESNDTVSEFLRSKIREMVKDPAAAELLAPKDHPFFTKRPPLENGYYETFNRDNVTLLNARTTPIEEITPRGCRISGATDRAPTSASPPAASRTCSSSPDRRARPCYPTCRWRSSRTWSGSRASSGTCARMTSTWPSPHKRGKTSGSSTTTRSPGPPCCSARIPGG